MSKRDYYEVLGVGSSAVRSEIKAAYRRLAVKYHPDRNGGDKTAEERFKEAAQAYAVLSDDQKRAAYDRFGHQGGMGGGFSGFDPEIFGDFSDILGDFFGLGDLFGARRRRSGSQPGADLRYELELTLEEAAFGVERQLEIPRLEVCDDCSGTGSADQVPPSSCRACGGRGQVRMSQGFLTVARTCPQCGGEGSVVLDPCRTCGGHGRSKQVRSIQVKIPPGVDAGTRLRLAGEGEHGRRGGRTGDLFVDIAVARHNRFQREGPHTYGEITVSYPQAVLGTVVEVETLHGATELKIPAGTEHGRSFRLRDHGIERLDRRGRGDHMVVVQVAVPHPRDLSEEELVQLRRLADLHGDAVLEERKVIDRVKDLFG